MGNFIRKERLSFLRENRQRREGGGKRKMRKRNCVYPLYNVLSQLQSVFYLHNGILSIESGRTEFRKKRKGERENEENCC